MKIGIGHAQTPLNLVGTWESNKGQVFTIDQIDNRIEWFDAEDGVKVVGEVSPTKL